MGLEAVELVITLEKEFKVSISDADSGSVRTVGDMYNLLIRLIREQNPGYVDKCKDFEDDVWKILVKTSKEVTGCTSGPEVTRETKYVDDLGYG
ncbi:MAG TPA: hypothetical protein DCZ94_10660 [Lentisphaeria bacterium]|nr:MAG: hypothetical protein A2X48_06535 [Lentisphaerae bacterium GWF2_49_21]HBC87406.1 hypothetical protein [Lentisphaeria bacterium]